VEVEKARLGQRVALQEKRHYRCSWPN